jgi:hypothetical protein
MTREEVCTVGEPIFWALGYNGSTPAQGVRAAGNAAFKSFQVSVEA